MYNRLNLNDDAAFFYPLYVILAFVFLAFIYFAAFEVDDSVYAQLSECFISPARERFFSDALEDGMVTHLENFLLTTFACEPPELPAPSSPAKQALIDAVQASAK